MQAALGQGFWSCALGLSAEDHLAGWASNAKPRNEQGTDLQTQGQNHDRFESVDRQDIRKSPYPRRGRHRCCGCGVVKRLGPEDCPIVLGKGQRQLWELPDGFLQNIPWAPGPEGGCSLGHSSNPDFVNPDVAEFGITHEKALGWILLYFHSLWRRSHEMVRRYPFSGLGSTTRFTMVRPLPRTITSRPPKYFSTGVGSTVWE